MCVCVPVLSACRRRRRAGHLHASTASPATHKQLQRSRGGGGGSSHLARCDLCETEPPSFDEHKLCCAKCTRAGINLRVWHAAEHMRRGATAPMPSARISRYNATMLRVSGQFKCLNSAWVRFTPRANGATRAQSQRNQNKNRADRPRRTVFGACVSQPAAIAGGHVVVGTERNATGNACALASTDVDVDRASVRKLFACARAFK